MIGKPMKIPFQNSVEKSSQQRKHLISNKLAKKRRGKTLKNCYAVTFKERIRFVM